MVLAQSSVPAALGEGLANFSEILARHAKDRPEHPALVSADGDSVWSYAELEQRVRRGAAVLRTIGLQRGQRAALLGANSLPWVASYLAILRAGGVAVPLNPHLTAAELNHLLGLVEPSLVLADLGIEAQAASEDEFQVLPLDLGLVEQPETVPAELDAGGPEDPADPEDIAVLIATSGTSGDPKAVMLSHRALLASCANSASISPTQGDTVALALLPMFHIYGLNAILGSALYLGATSVIVDGYPENLGAVIAARGVTEVPITPSVLYRLTQDERVAEHLRNVEHVMSGGAPLSLALADRFTSLTGLELQQGYGMTETAPVIASTRGIAAGERDRVRARARELGTGGHVGPAIGGVEIRIGADAGHDATQPGEIHVRGDNLLSGYWPDVPDGLELMDAPKKVDVLDADGWFATGDIGFLDAGQLYLVDRASDLIIVSGFNVYPTEVERVLARIPGITEAAVLGQPDENTGERVVAFVAVGRAKPSLASVRAECAERLARYKRPVEIYYLPKLPKTKAGKVAKPRLRAMLDTVEAH